MCYNEHDKKEYLSSGRTIDYAESIFLTKGNNFYSNRSNIMFEIIEDTVKKHDFLLTPCSAKMFEIAYDERNPHFGCHDNLAQNLAKYGITPDEIPVTFNIFMNVEINSLSGKIAILTPWSKEGDYLILKAKMDLIVGLTACSDKLTNNDSYKPINYQISAE